MNAARRKWRVIFSVYCLVGAGLVFLFTKGSSEVSTQYATVTFDVHQMAFQVDGRVEEVLVDDNGQVAEGDVLARLDEAPFIAELKEAEGKLAEAEATREAARYRLEIVRVTTTEALATAKADVVAAQAGQRIAQADLEQKAFEKRQIAQAITNRRGAVSLQKEQKSINDYDQSAAEVESAVARVAVAKANERKAMTGPEVVLAAEKALALAKAAVQKAEAEVERAQLNLNYCTVRAPADGHVSHKNIEIGDYFKAQKPMMAIIARGTPWISARFREPDADRIRPGQKVELVLDAYPDKEFEGVVESIEAGTYDSSSLFSSYMNTARTGYYSWLMQRVPVKIRVPNYQFDAEAPWRLGLNTNVVVLDPEASNKFFN